jgi:hypothetical protein
MEINRDTYTGADEKTRNLMTFDLLTGIHEKVDKLNIHYETHIGVCDKRFKKLENRKKIDAALSGGAGLVGGFIAQVTGWFK